LLRSLATGGTIALYMTAAFALVPALGNAEGAGGADGSRAAAEGVVVAIGLMVITVGTAVARWMREESPAA
jgi:hypothetical protein